MFSISAPIKTRPRLKCSSQGRNCLKLPDKSHACMGLYQLIDFQHERVAEQTATVVLKEDACEVVG
jgi:hypothetical protein